MLLPSQLSLLLFVLLFSCCPLLLVNGWSSGGVSTSSLSFLLHHHSKQSKNNCWSILKATLSGEEVRLEEERLERASISGVSVSRNGFHALLDTSEGTLPLPITRDPQDSYAATSPQALTLIQLLSGVDMAGAILPPETLSKMVILYCELVPELFASPSQRAVVEYVQKSLPDDTNCFSEAHPWTQSRVKLPQVTLDQLELIYINNNNSNNNNQQKEGEEEGKKDGGSSNNNWICRFQCALKSVDDNNEWKDTMTMDVTPEILIPVTYKYEKDTSALFTCLCLALRYKAPIIIRNLKDVPIPNNLDDNFPQRTTVANLQSTSTRVTQNIERGFEIHTLTKALRIAMEKGDTGAIERIRSKLDEYDSMDDLPTINDDEIKSKTGNNDDDDSGSSSSSSDDMDDLDDNILQ